VDYCGPDGAAPDGAAPVGAVGCPVSAVAPAAGAVDVQTASATSGQAIDPRIGGG
jgi:hypothetical protein